MTRPRSKRSSSDVQASMDTILIHDLRGPTLNAMAFNNELAQATERLCIMMKDPHRQISEEERVQISEILGSDMQPCVNFVKKALISMEERLSVEENERFSG